MKKYVLSMIAVFCFVFNIGIAQVSAQHFNYEEAYQILHGTWHDTEKNKDIQLVWKSYDGSECNIVNNKGFTDPYGESQIYFDFKGKQGRMLVTYYHDQGAYYGEFQTKESFGWWTVYFSLVK